jgi:hypothetical protein
VHEAVGEAAALGVVVPLHRIVRIRRGIHLHGLAEADGHLLERAHELRVHRLHLDRADHADRNDGHAAFTREPRHAGPALVHVGVERAGALGVEAEEVALAEHVGPRRLERALAGAPPAPTDGDLPGGPEEPCRLLRVEVLRLGQERDLAGTTRGMKNESQKDWWLAASTAGPDLGMFSRPSTLTRQRTKKIGLRIP